MKRLPAMVCPRQLRSPVRGALAWLLMLAVLFGQGLGVVHSISHGAPGATGTAQTQAHARSHAHAHPRPHAHAPSHAQALALPGQHAHGPACDHGPDHGQAPGLQSLFDHAPDEPGCRLYDQLLQAGPLMPVALVLTAPARTRAAPPPDTGVRLAAPAAVYQARGPPRV